MSQAKDYVVFQGRVITPPLLELIDFISGKSLLHDPVDTLISLNFLQIKLLESARDQEIDDRIIASLYMHIELIRLINEADSALCQLRHYDSEAWQKYMKGEPGK